MTNDIKSAKESICIPNSHERLYFRAIFPSMMSNAPAIQAKTMAMKKLPSWIKYIAIRPAEMFANVTRFARLKCEFLLKRYDKLIPT